MLRHYLTVSLRNILRNKLASAISVLGLAVALCGALLVYAYVRWESGYDAHLTDKEHVYRVIRSTESNSGTSYNVRTSGRLGTAIKAAHPEVVSITRLLRRRIFIGTGERGDAALLCAADPNVIRFCAVEVTRGSAESLKRPNTVALSESYARMLFGSVDVVGRTVELEESFLGTYEVVAVFEDMTRHSTIWFDALAFADPPAENQHWSSGMAAFYNWNAQGWLPFETFIELRPDADVSGLEAGIQQLLDLHLPDVAANNAYHLQPFDRMYLHTLPDYNVPGLAAVQDVQYGDADRLGGAVLVALMLVLVAAANWVNLMTARATLRQREVGVRKVVGALRSELVRQFVGEALLVTAVAIVLGAGFAYLSLDPFRDLVQSDVLVERLSFVDGFLIFSGATGVGVLAGLYPAIFLSGFSPMRAIQNQAETMGKGGLLRRGLVTLQFATSIVLIAYTIVLTDQVQFMRVQKMGFQTEQILSMPLYRTANQTRYWGNYAQDLKRQYRRVAERFTGHPEVVGATSTRFDLLSYFPGTVRSLDSQETGEIPIAFLSVEESFLEFFDIHLLAGRGIRPETVVDGRTEILEMVVTETAVPAFGFDSPEEAIGKRLKWHPRQWMTGTIVGVIGDLQFGSVKDSPEPLMLVPGVGNFKRLFVKVTGKRIPDAMQHIEQTWKHYLPDRPFEYAFLDERIDALYRAEQGQQRLLSVFSLLAVAIGVMGVFGLAAFLAERRLKEVCVRKVLGARPGSLVYLLMRDHITLVLTASLVAIPTAAWLSDRWLADYATRIDLTAWPFAIASVVCVAATFLAVALPANRAIRVDPARNLRQE